ncbi:14756_t:CDS:2, partial [Funneliformis geosporum]
LRIQYKDPSRAMILRYRHEYTSSEEYISNNNKIGDVFDGNRYKSLVALGLFSDYRDPQGYNRTNYNPENLPMRTHISYLQDIEAIENEIRGARTRIQRERDINGRSILLELCSIDFPASFSIDIMHALFENVAPHMFRHFSGKFFNNEMLNNTDYKISFSNWNKITKTIEQNQKMMPKEFGRHPINIQKYHSAFKAEDWYNWIAKFVKATQLCLEPVISKQELEEIQTLFVGFVRHYENEYYQRDSDRLPAILISFYYLLHIMKSIQETGPPCAFQKETKILPLERAFSFSATEEELHSPSQKYNMIKTEVQKVKQYYATALDLMMNEIGEIIEHIQKYGKLRTKSEALIGSKLVNCKGDVARNNYSIAAKLLVDKNAHLLRAHNDFEEREFYGNNIQYFHNFGETSVINVTAIDRCVGFLEVAANNHIIIDRENWITSR